MRTQTSEGHFAITNGRLVLPDRVADDLAIVINGSRIVDIAPPESLPPTLDRIDAGGRYIAPGLIDIHTHGAQNHVFNEASPEAFLAITQAHLAHGTTALLATTVTGPVPDLVQCLTFSRTWMAQAQPGAHILGVHLEGPYFAPAQAGAQDPRHLRTPDDDSVATLLAHADVVKIVSFAPELPAAVELTGQLRARGIVAAAGHSAAREEDLVPAIQAGLSHVIHIWSAQSSTIREGPWRKPGLLEVSLVYDDLTVEMIADNRHLPPTLMKLAYRSIGPDRLCIVSDATSGAGLPDGAHFRMGGMEYLVEDGVGMMLDRSAFGGSTTFLNEMIPVLVETVGVPLHEAVRMASLNPARVIGVDDRKGSLASGKDADLVIFDANFTPRCVMLQGQWVPDVPTIEKARGK